MLTASLPVPVAEAVEGLNWVARVACISSDVTTGGVGGGGSGASSSPPPQDDMNIDIANTAARPVKNLFRLCCLMITPSLNILTAHMNSMHPS
jgi:hypothetical protein